jgi:hypothetical protein
MTCENDNIFFSVISIDETVFLRWDRFAFLGFSLTKTAGNSELTAGAAAVLEFAKPSAAQDFRGERDVDR